MVIAETVTEVSAILVIPFAGVKLTAPAAVLNWKPAGSVTINVFAVWFLLMPTAVISFSEKLTVLYPLGYVLAHKY